MAEGTHYLRERLLLLLAPPWLDEVGVLAEAPPSDEMRPSRPNFASLLSGSFRFSNHRRSGGERVHANESKIFFFFFRIRFNMAFLINNKKEKEKCVT